MDLYLYVLVILIPLLAQGYITINYNSNKKKRNNLKLTGYEVARKILDDNNLKDLYIVETKGKLTDHYDPTRKVIRLSSEVYNGNSISSLAIASHECGHALQDKENYKPLKIRAMLVPIVNISSYISYILIVIGLVLEAFDLIYLGIGITVIGLIFQIITLPVEFNASKRAKEIVKNYGEKSNGVDNVLNAAALTYVAGVLSSLLQIIRLLLNIRNDN